MLDRTVYFNTHNNTDAKTGILKRNSWVVIPEEPINIAVNKGSFSDGHQGDKRSRNSYYVSNRQQEEDQKGIILIHLIL